MYLKILNKIFRRFKSLGIKETRSGASLIGKAEFIAPNAWLHKTYEPLSEEELNELETKLSIEIPFPYKEFLRQTNGCKLFNTTLTVDGYQRNYHRDEESVWQPFDLILTNVDERIPEADVNIFFIGGYDWDGSLVYLDRITNRIMRCSREDIRPLNIWQNLELFLEAETERLLCLFDSKGQEIDEDISTAPEEEIDSLG